MDIPDSISDQAKAVYAAMRDDCGKTSSLHPRRTLDQFSYSTLPETSERDRDQVVSKNTGPSRGGKKMIMVDQLWLWVLRNEQRDTTVFTCFPQKYEEEGGKGEEECFHGLADLRQGILDEMNGRDDDCNWENMVGLALDQAVNGMLNVRNEQSLDFLGVFRMAVGKAVSPPPRILLIGVKSVLLLPLSTR